MSFWEKVFSGKERPVAKERGPKTEAVEASVFSQFYNGVKDKVEALGGRMTAVGNEDVVIGFFLPLENVEAMKSFLLEQGYVLEGSNQAVLADPGGYMNFVVSTDDGRGQESMFRVTPKE